MISGGHNKKNPLSCTPSGHIVERTAYTYTTTCKRIKYPSTFWHADRRWLGHKRKRFVNTIVSLWKHLSTKIPNAMPGHTRVRQLWKIRTRILAPVCGLSPGVSLSTPKMDVKNKLDFFSPPQFTEQRGRWFHAVPDPHKEPDNGETRILNTPAELRDSFWGFLGTSKEHLGTANNF